MPFGNEEAYSDPSSPFYDPAKAAQLAAMRAGGGMGAPPMARPGMAPPGGMGGALGGAPPGAAAGAAPGAIGGAMSQQMNAGMSGPPPSPGVGPGMGPGMGEGIGGDDLDPALIESVLQLGNLKDRSQRLGDKLRAAQELTSAAMPEGRSAGGVYQAAHPLEFLGSLAQRAAGKYQTGKLEKEFGPLEEQQLGGRRQYLQAKLRGPRRPNAQLSSNPGSGSPGSLRPGQEGADY